MIAASAMRYEPAVEAAFLAEYGIDTLDPRVTPRRILTLYRHMRPGVLSDPDDPGVWSYEAYLLAQVVDAVNQVSWTVAAVNSKQKPKQPKPMKRPGHRKSGKIGWGQLAEVLEGA